MTTRNEVDEHLWDSDGALSRSTAVTGTVRCASWRKRNHRPTCVPRRTRRCRRYAPAPRRCRLRSTRRRALARPPSIRRWSTLRSEQRKPNCHHTLPDPPLPRSVPHPVPPPATQVAARSSWLERVAQNTPELRAAQLKRNLQLPAPPPLAEDDAARFAQLAVRGSVGLGAVAEPASLLPTLSLQDSLDDGICRLAAVAIAQNALQAVKRRRVHRVPPHRPGLTHLRLYDEAAELIQAHERGRQARARFKPLRASIAGPSACLPPSPRPSRPPGCSRALACPAAAADAAGGCQAWRTHPSPAAPPPAVDARKRDLRLPPPPAQSRAQLPGSAHARRRAVRICESPSHLPSQPQLRPGERVM